MHIRIFITLTVLFFSTNVNGGIQHHIILKNDFNNDGIADRVIFASYGISGMVQSTRANKKVDTFYFKQGNRTIFFTSDKTQGGPYIKLTENAGFFTVISFLKYENKTFQHINSFSVPSTTYFEEDPFAVPSTDPFAEIKSESKECTPPDAFNNTTIKESLSWVEATQKYSVEEAIKKAIGPECKTVFGKDYDKLEKQVLSACGISSGKPEKNTLISCLDKSENTRILSATYKMALAEKIFDDGFKITCGKTEGISPQESFTSTSNTLSLFQTNPAIANRNFTANFFHGMMHREGVVDDKKVEALVQMCVLKNKKVTSEYGLQTHPFTIEMRNLKNKDGVEINISPKVKEIPQASVAATVYEGTKTLDANPSMDNAPQFKSLSTASKATFKSFEPLMNAAFNAAVPTAFAQNTIGSSHVATGKVAVAIPTTKGIKTTSSSRSIVSGATFDISSLPESISPSPNGELGNGMIVKASAINIEEISPRSPAAIPSTSSEVASGNSAGNGGFTNSEGRSGNLASIKTTSRPDLRNNVPQLKAQEDLMRTLTTGKYEDVKAMLTNPANEPLLREMKIQYSGKSQTLGSTQPDIILKDLGNKFSILRVNVE